MRFCPWQRTTAGTWRCNPSSWVEAPCTWSSTSTDTSNRSEPPRSCTGLPQGVSLSPPEGGGMNHWKETAEILSRLAGLRTAGRRAALATVVHIVGSAYRRPGAKFLIEESGDTLGSVSGGCLEADVREVAKGVLATGHPSLRHYSTGADEDIVWGLGLGCN